MFDNVDVTGNPVICKKWWNVGGALPMRCVEAAAHRIDPDLELCICKHCGQGWVRNVDAWMRLTELLEKLATANQAMINSVNTLRASCSRLMAAVGANYKDTKI